MKYSFTIIGLLLFFSTVKAQETVVYMLRKANAKDDTTTYKRMIRFDKTVQLYYVSDYFEDGKIQMEAIYRSFDKNVKEDYQCNYRTNTKEGFYTQWYPNGQTEYQGFYRNGLSDGLSTSWYPNGQKEAEEHWLNGQLDGRVKYWSENGDLQFESTFIHGINQHPRNVTYQYLTYLPDAYSADITTKWPLIIYLHGGSSRGKDLRKLYASGIPDQIYRGRSFPFIIISPQCPEHLRWSTENWFANFFNEITAKYNIDPNRIYLTGQSLGGSGTWYLAAKYPGTFAAIAPMCGFTSDNEYTQNNLRRLMDMSIWAFHGQTDETVPFEETERIIQKLEGKNKDLRFTAEPSVGHSIHWLIYPNKELYDWFLMHHR